MVMWLIVSRTTQRILTVYRDILTILTFANVVVFRSDYYASYNENINTFYFCVVMIFYLSLAITEIDFYTSACSSYFQSLIKLLAPFDYQLLDIENFHK